MGANLALLRAPQFRLLWLSSLAWAGAQWMERVITGWLALGLGGDALAVGAVFAIRLVPFVALGLVAGTVADRFSRRQVLIVVAAAAVALNGVLAVLLALGTVELWHLLAIGIAAGSVQVFDMTTRGALVVDLVGRERAAGAIALNAVALRLFGAVGAFAGGVVMQYIGPAVGYASVAVVYALALVLVVILRPPTREAVATTQPVESFGAALAGTARLIARNPAVRMVVIASLACETFGYSHQAALPSIARDVLLTGSEGLGALTAAASIGATLAVIVLAALPPDAGRRPLLSMVLFGWGLALIGLGASKVIALSLATMLVVGACMSAIDVLQQTIAQMAVPEDQRGRAVGVWAFSIGMNVVGLLQVGSVVSLIGAPLAMFVNGVGAATSALLIAFFAPAYRWANLRRAPSTT